MYGLYRFIFTCFTAIMVLFGMTTETQFTAPIDMQNGGDPFIVESEGETFYTFTTGSTIEIRKIVSYKDTTVLEKKTVYSSGSDGIKGHIWAPEIHKIGDKWYIVSCALFDENAVPRGKMPNADADEEHDDFYRYGFVLESRTEDVFGEYVFKGYLAPDGLNNIDGTYLKKDGKLYYVSSCYVDVAHQCLYITEMENPYTLKAGAPSVKLSSPDLSWEKKGWRVNEGPAVLYHKDDIFIVYSASGYSSDYYCMGMLTLKGNDVTKASGWSKSLSRVKYDDTFNDIYNVGHCSFLYRKNGDIYMVYHANKTKEFDDSPRLTYIEPVTFNKYGNPLFYG